jgi:hypothetical protein
VTAIFSSVQRWAPRDLRRVLHLGVELVAPTIHWAKPVAALCADGPAADPSRERGEGLDAVCQRALIEAEQRTVTRVNGACRFIAYSEAHHQTRSALREVRKIFAAHRCRRLGYGKARFAFEVVSK